MHAHLTLVRRESFESSMRSTSHPIIYTGSSRGDAQMLRVQVMLLDVGDGMSITTLVCNSTVGVLCATVGVEHKYLVLVRCMAGQREGN